jgi:hypothetical protein
MSFPLGGLRNLSAPELSRVRAKKPRVPVVRKLRSSMQLAEAAAFEMGTELDMQGAAVLHVTLEHRRQVARLSWVEEDGTEIQWAEFMAMSDERDA